MEERGKGNARYLFLRVSSKGVNVDDRYSI